MKCQYFSGKKEGNIDLSSAEFAHNVVMVKLLVLNLDRSVLLPAGFFNNCWIGMRVM